MAVIGYVHGKIKLGPFEWKSNGTWTDEAATVGIIVLFIYYGFHGLVAYRTAVNERIKEINKVNRDDVMQPK